MADNTNRGIVPATVTRRTISPYDLSPSDNPGCVISQPALRGSNYDEWAANLRLSLMARKKFGFVDGTILKPSEDSADLEDWRCNNALVVSWIRLTVEPQIRSSLRTFEIGQDLWDHIKKRFSVKNGAKIGKIKTDLAAARQSGRTVEAYFGHMNQLWTVLDDYRNLEACKCGLCTCDLSGKIAQAKEEDRVYEFLRGLDDSYSNIRSTLISRVPFPNLDDVYLAVTQEEDSRVLTSVKDTNVSEMGFAVQSTRPIVRSEKTRGTCTSCGRSGHSSDQCFQTIGYPDWWGDRPRHRLSGSDRGGVRTRGRESTGLTSDRLAVHPKPRGNGTAHAVVAESSKPDHIANLALTDTDRTGLVGLTNDQWRGLVKLLEERKITDDTPLSGNICFSNWIYDTGATNHMTGNLGFLYNIRYMAPVGIKLPDNSISVSTQQGSVRLDDSLSLHNVFFVPGLSCHLISVSQLARARGCVFQITDKLCIVQDRITRTLIGASEQRNGLYFFRRVAVAGAVHCLRGVSSEVLHKRLGHPSSKVLGKVSGVDFSNKFDSTKCDICIRAKQTRDVFQLSSNKAVAIFDLIHVDLWGPYRVPALCGSRYFLTIVDDYSRAVWIYLLHTKIEVADHLKRFLAFTNRQFNKKVRAIRSDNGTEFMVMSDYFLRHGIHHETTCVATPQQNGRVERKHRHILNVARALRFQANLPIEFGGHCAMTACYLINRLPSEVLKGKTPFELIYGRSPPLDHLRVFGCLCYAHNYATGGDKFAARSLKCIFIGYPTGKRGWRVYDLETKKIFVSRDVLFLEDTFGHIAPEIPIEISAPSTAPQQFFDDASPIVDSPHDIEHDPAVVVETAPTQARSCEPAFSSSRNETAPAVVVETAPEHARPRRHRTPNVRLADYVVDLNAVTIFSDSDTKPAYPLAHYLNNDRFSSIHRAFLSAVLATDEPKSFKQAMHDANWRLAVRKEIEALEDNGTWSLEELPTGKTAIGCQWVFKLKYNSDGTLERHKARLVVLGNKQVAGSDYDETFAPVAKMTTVRCLLEVSAARNWDVFQMDVHNAFLHGDLHEEVYMRLPPGFPLQDKSKVCRLRKSLYGLKQAPRCWFEKLSTALLDYGFVHSPSDYSLFTLIRPTFRIHLLVYVDDLIVTGDSSAEIQSFKDYLSSCFRMKDLGKLKYFLGIEVARSSSGFYLSQRKYALDIIAECGLLGAKPVRFPLDQNHRLALAAGPVLADPTKYRRLIGRLIYLRETRPELSYSIHVLSQFMQNPLEAHWEAALRVVRYLKCYPGQGILLRSDCDLKLTAWCDADYAGCPLTRRSLTGWFIQLGGSPISWKTKKQPTVSLSSAEAEYRAMQFAVKEIVWLKALLGSLGVSHDHPISLHCDNLAAIHISGNPVFHERTKHVEADCHFVRDKVLDGTIAMQHTSTKLQLADIFTKALGRMEFDAFRSKLGVIDLHAPP